MTTATKTRRLVAVTDDYQPDPAPANATLTLDRPGRRAELAEQHDNAALAALAPEVVEEQRAAIAKAMRAAGQENADLRAILLDLTRSMLVLGYMNGAADQQQTGHLELARETLAEIVVLETRDRQAARQAEHVLKAVKP